MGQKEYHISEKYFARFLATPLPSRDFSKIMFWGKEPDPFTKLYLYSYILSA